ncbi:MAG: Universal stress protein F [Pelotomaculum sp. PtaB.Bin104]|nr:MAG: Universal stress protein F [Pelotomaculum sp. PtaB.Bin104]
MIGKILVAYDTEELSKKALDIAVQMAKSQNAEIHIVTSVKIPDYLFFNMPFGGDSTAFADLDDNIRADYEKKLIEAGEKVKAEGVPVKTAFFKENPGEAIVNYADKEQVDLIIIGSHNRKGLFKAVLGSVSNYVVYHAQCAVMVLKA